VAWIVAVACGDHSTELFPDDSLPGLVELVVTPAESTIEIADLAADHAVELVATGRFVDGSSRDVTDLVAWASDRDDAGGFAAPGRWLASNRAAGPVAVEARSGSIAGAATIAVRMRIDVVDPVFPPPPGAIDLFDPATPVVVGDAMRSPRIVYPAHDVMFPINLYRILFQYDTGTAADVFRIAYRSTWLDIHVYTTGDRWQPDEVQWGYLALTTAGDKLAMTVSGIDTADPTTIWDSAPIDLNFSRSAVDGAIYYWSTSSEGVMKGTLSQSAPTKFYTSPPDTTCVACHTVSRDGRRLAVGYDGERLQEVAVPSRDVIIPAGRDMGWSTFSPDGRLLLVAHRGVMTLLDADTGATVGPGDGVVPTPGVFPTHPDWSPLGDEVAMSVCTMAADKDVSRCSIARIPYDAGTWGATEILVPAGAGEDNNFFPKYSPDGAWIAYVNATGKSKDQPTSELRLIPTDGGTPTVLVTANRRVGPDDGVPGVGNTMPTWAPSTHPGTQWLVFSSIRRYGKVLMEPMIADQLWIAAIDTARAGDPSYAAFWLPLQDVGERNHRAFWALDAEQPCNGGPEVCDGFDNDCDGIVDDDCLPCVAEEICFDGIDNNCDGVIDPCVE
jgi:hypothetical protein